MEKVTYNDIWETQWCPKDWGTKLIVNMYKKGHRKECRNYREISISSATNLYACIVKYKLGKYSTNNTEKECKFRKGKWCTDASFILQQIQENRKLTYPLLFYLLTMKMPMATYSK